MKNFKDHKPPGTLQGNILAKSSKLTIEVVDDEEVYTGKFNKNSPTNAKLSAELQKPGTSVFAIKGKPPLNTITKRCYGDPVVAKAPQKIFKFPASPRVDPKHYIARSGNIYSTRSQSKTNPSKISLTPTQKSNTDLLENRSKSTTSSEKQLPKGETWLNSLVTQVKNIPNTLTSVLTESEVKAKSDLVYKEHLFQTFQAVKFIKTLPPVNLELLKLKRVNVPRRKGYELKKTLIFDLDETLVHCCEENSEIKPMVKLPIVFPTGEVILAGINIRPYALECLREVNKDFEVFVFTASHPCYANVVLDYLDPKKELIHHRFFRDSCINMAGVYIKDLRIFANRNLKDLVIVDNATYSFAYQIDNGIPIVSWYDDPYDKELYSLMDYVKTLAVANDVREVNSHTFHLSTFYEDYMDEFIPSGSPRIQRKT